MAVRATQWSDMGPQTLTALRLDSRLSVAAAYILKTSHDLVQVWWVLRDSSMTNVCSSCSQCVLDASICRSRHLSTQEAAVELM